MSRFDEALPPLKKALEIEPDSANSYVLLGRVYNATKNYPEGRSALEEAVQINPFNPLIYRLLVDIYGALGDQAQAQQAKATLDKLLTSK
jgi:cytochrome c-type biogenesis protein CcmH/NrfG